MKQKNNGIFYIICKCMRNYIYKVKKNEFDLIGEKRKCVCMFLINLYKKICI